MSGCFSTFVIGCGGKVKRVNAGFASAGSGQHDVRRRAEFKAEIDRLLAERG